MEVKSRDRRLHNRNPCSAASFFLSKKNLFQCQSSITHLQIHRTICHINNKKQKNEFNKIVMMICSREFHCEQFQQCVAS